MSKAPPLYRVPPDMSARMTWVITVVGPDRSGLVDALSTWVKGAGGDWQNSHLAHIGDQFAGILEVSVPEQQRATFEEASARVAEETGLSLTLKPVGEAPRAGTLHHLSCLGQDRPGIVKALTDVLLEVQANIETLETTTREAPMSGEQLFEARFAVRLPEHLDLDQLQERLSGIGEELMLDVQVQ